MVWLNAGGVQMSRRVAIVALIAAAVIAGLAYLFWSGNSAKNLDGNPAQADSFIQSTLSDLPETDRAKLQSQLDLMRKNAEMAMQEAISRADIPALAQMALQGTEAKSLLTTAWNKIQSGNYTEQEIADAKRPKMSNSALGLGGPDSEVETELTRATSVNDVLEAVRRSISPDTTPLEKAVIAQAILLTTVQIDQATKFSPVVPEALARYFKMTKAQQSASGADRIAKSIIETEPCFGVTSAGAGQAKGELNVLGVSLRMSATERLGAVCAAANQPIRLVENKTNEYCINCSDDVQRSPLDRLLLGQIIQRERQFQSVRRVPNPMSPVPDVQRDVAPVSIKTIMDGYVRQFGQPNYSISGNVSVTYGWIRKRDGSLFAANHWTKVGGLALNGRAVGNFSNSSRADQQLREKLGMMQPHATYCLANLNDADDPVSGAFQFDDVWPVSPAIFHFNLTGFEMSQQFKGLTNDTRSRSSFEAVGKNDDCGQILLVTVTRDNGQRFISNDRVELYAGVGSSAGDDAMTAMTSAMGIAALSARLGDAGAFIAARREKEAADLRERESATAEAQRQARAAEKGFHP